MGTWIGHLRVAECLLAALPGLDEVAFTLGSLAPDSGILVDAEAYRFEPPKEVTHFLRKGEDEAHIRDLEFYRTHMASITLDADPARYSFCLAYFFHLLCDNLWWLRVGRPHKDHYAAHFEAQGKAAWDDCKRDWYDLDHLYVRDHRESLYWRVFLPAPNPPPYLAFLHEPALIHQLDSIRQFYRQPDPTRTLDRPYPYLNEATMARFVTDATEAILSVYRQVTGEGAPIALTSAMGMLPAEVKAPYAAPLGDVNGAL
jgi:hypothetical protein